MCSASRSAARRLATVFLLLGLGASAEFASARQDLQPSPASPFQAFTKYDFVPGQTLVAFDDFGQDEIGDFPARWNTNGSGEVVTIGGQPGRWLKLSRGGYFAPGFVKAIPDNVTIEFDVIVAPTFNSGIPLSFALAELSDAKEAAAWQYVTHNVSFTLHPGVSDGVSDTQSRQDGESAPPNRADVPQLAAQSGRPVHVAVWRQNRRFRVYIAGTKVWDVPQAVASSARLNAAVFFVGNVDAGFEYHLSNVRVAVGAPDARNKLLTDGRWTTHGILFDVNSDRIRGESYGTLKEIAGVLTQDTSVRVVIVGHTDADGDEASNLDLSKRRAAAVKAALVREFAIDAGRMETDGKGESQPMDKNDTTAGKASNRRVEFVKK